MHAATSTRSRIIPPSSVATGSPAALPQISHSANSTPDFSRAAGPAAIPPINTQRAVTTLLVNDGETTVIGGIYTSNQQTASDRTPGLSQIPILSWLFKRERIDDQSTELLIFITPRIIKV